MKRHWPIIILGLLGMIAVMQSSSFHAYRAEAKELVEKLDSLRGDSVPLMTSFEVGAVLSTIEREKLEQRSARIYQLRGDVTLARQRQERLAAQVQKLTDQSRARTNQSASVEAPSFPPDYRPRHELADRGAATIEATIETFWWASTQGDIGKLRQVVLRPTQLLSPPGSTVSEPLRAMFQRFPGFRIVKRDIKTDHHVKVGVETIAGGSIRHLMLVATNSQWLISMEESDLR